MRDGLPGARARIDVRPRPDAIGVIRIHTGGFAERARRTLGIRDPAVLVAFDWPGTIADPAVSRVGDTVRLVFRRTADWPVAPQPPASAPA